MLLKDVSSNKVVPISIGNAEATAIAIALQEKKFPRPLPHDLMKTVIETAGCALDKVVIVRRVDETYFSTIFLQDANGKIHEIDSRRSDAIALALRMQTPIFITEEVFSIVAVDDEPS